MGDEENAFALITEPGQHLEQASALLRRQDRCRFIEDQQTAVANQQLDQLDPLLGADRQFPDRTLQIEVELEFIQNLLDLLLVLTAGVKIGHSFER